MKKKLAVFDIDGTIFRYSLLIKLVDEFIARKLFPASTPRMYAKAYQAWLDRKGSYQDYLDRVVQAYNKHLKGVSYAKFLKIVDVVAEREKTHTYRYTRDLVKELNKKDYFTIAISHSPKPAVDIFCKSLGFKKVYGLMLERDAKGKLTGEKLYTDLIFHKDKILERAIEKHGLTLKDSIGVGDTDSDIAFLKLVAHPICFNPNKKLYDYARKQRGWKIVVERKDVIYHL